MLAGAFTILELLIVLGIIFILAVIGIATVSGLRGRAQRVQCTMNLKNLYAGAEVYVQQNGQWPQIHTPETRSDPKARIAETWIAALEPFSVPRKIWICPAIQDSLHNPDYTQAGNARIDYGATQFDDKPTSPHEWPRQPWFIERGNVHGNGNLIIFADGSISDLTTAMAESGQ